MAHLPATPTQPQSISAPPSRIPGRRRWLLPAALGLLYVAQCAWFLQTQSLTYDEPVHIAEGLEAWRHGRFEQYNDHPPLARLLCAFPLRNERWQIDIEPRSDGFRVTRIAPDPVALAWRARAVNVLLGLVLAGLVWWTAGRVFSEGAANFALALFVFSPAMIAHFSLATTDGAATLFIFAAAVGVARWRETPTAGQTVLLGLVLGLLLLAKFSTPIIFVTALVWMLIPEKRTGQSRGYLWKVPAIFLISLFTLWAGYFFHVSRLKLGDGQLVVSYPHRNDTVYPVKAAMRLSIWVPAGEYVEGLRNTLRHNARGQPAFFLGQISATGGWKAYFPVVVLLKWPTVVVVLFLISLWLMVRGGVRPERWFWVLASFPAIYFLAALFAHFDLGERHILPVYPFVVLFAAGAWQAVRKRRALTVCLTLLLALHAADGLRYAPDYLSYFTVFVPSSESYRLLSDSNLDWGQGLLALREYEAAHPKGDLWLAYFGSVEPAVYGIRARPLAEGERVQGTVVVSATHLSGQYLQNPAGYRWLLQHPPAAVLDHSLFVFGVEKIP